MKNILSFVLAVGLAIGIISQNTVSQDLQDWHLWGLPEGVQARFGKGGIRGNITYSHDGKNLAVSCSNGIWIYDAHTDEPLHFLTGHTDFVLMSAFSPDGLLLASGSGDMTIRLWDARTGTELRTINKHTDGVEGIAFSPDGTLLASGSYDHTICLWNVQTDRKSVV